MACEHQNGVLQLFTYEQDHWQRRCLCCGSEESANDPGYSTAAGIKAAHALRRRDAHRFTEAAELLREAFELSGDTRFLFAALLCRLGVIWCGDEYQPTFFAHTLPSAPLTLSAEWQTIENADALPEADAQAMRSALALLEEILSWLRRNEGKRGCDVFICYRRTDAAVHHALRLYRDLTDEGLNVFCADVTTAGKTQEQFESEVWFALRTAEHLVLIPGQGGDAMSPWLHNELARAACDITHRMVCTEDCTAVPAEIAREGECLSMDAVRTRLIRSASNCTPGKLWTRAIAALHIPGQTLAAEALLRRASAKGNHPARLLLAALYEEGLALPQDAPRAALYRQLAGSASEEERRQVNAILQDIEQACGSKHRQALIYLVADVSDTGVKASRALMGPLISALHADRRLAGAQLCIVGYDRHAQVLEEPMELSKYGLAERAVMALRTSREAGRDRAAYAGKGLRCAANHCCQQHTGDQVPLLVLLRPCLTNDAEASVPAAMTMLKKVFPNASSAEIRSIDQLPACLAALRQQL